MNIGIYKIEGDLVGNLILVLILIVALFTIYQVNKFIKIDKKARLIPSPKPTGKVTFSGNFFLGLSNYLSMRKKKPIQKLSETGEKELAKAKKLSIFGLILLIILIVIYLIV